MYLGKLTDEDIELMAALRRQGLLLREIGRKWDVHESTVSKALKRRNNNERKAG